ncbi:MAG: SDR family oxidoreductase [Flavobacteriales bacterium]|jgi:NAD(P)-dependent dehydrogenase (short-subunit alcohol dehydrogenase family)|nr:SDR family oxidoreductase [Flavobacteriales bacterium]
MDLKNKVALVTGAGSGIGEAVALLFAQHGARLVLTDVDMAGCERVANAVKAAGAEAITVRNDVSVATECEAAVAAALKAFGRLDVAVNNAGIGGPPALTGDYPLDGWHQVVNVNLNGVFYGMRYQIPAMLKGGGGSIINIASILGQVGFATASAYVAAKHGVVGLSKNAAMEYAAQGIRVNSVGPAFIRTPLLTKHLTEEQLTGIAAMHPIARLGKPEEVAELVVWLASDKASFVTGSYYAVDGGYLAR